MNEQLYPTRTKLPHEVPSWVAPGSRYFITINCHERGADLLCMPQRSAVLLESVSIYERLGRWCMWLFVLMPDHVHMIASFEGTREFIGLLRRGRAITRSSWGSSGRKVSLSIGCDQKMNSWRRLIMFA
jgi:hypothetical protein